MTPFELAAADRQQVRAFNAAIAEIRLDREAFAREEIIAETPRQRYRRHFDACTSARDPLWVRLTEYRVALLLIEQCENMRALADKSGLSPKTAHFLWERDFQAAQIARRLLAHDLRAMRTKREAVSA